MEFRTGYNYDVDVVSRETGLEFDEEQDKTQQQFRDEVDINTIVERFGLTGTVPATFRMPLTGSFEDVGDFHSAMNAIRAAEESFMQLPGKVRAKFENDPQALMRFMEDPKNKKECEELGLLKLKPEVPRDKVPDDAVPTAPPAVAPG